MPFTLAWSVSAVSVGFVPATAGILKVMCSLADGLLLNATSGGTFLLLEAALAAESCSELGAEHGCRTRQRMKGLVHACVWRS